MAVRIYRLSFAMGLTVVAGGALAQSAADAPQPQEEIVVTAKKLDTARDLISPSLGASDYVIDSKAIQNTPQGVNASFNQVLLQAPGVTQDSYGQLHIRNEHGNLQYRINGIILPEGISGFGQALDPRFAESLDLMTGTLPAQYGYRTAGIVNIQTKSGAFDQGGEVSLYGGSHGEFQPSFAASGSSGAFSYYLSGSYLENDLGVENPTASHDPIHDHTTQFHGFAYLSYIPTSDARVSAMLGTSIGYFQIPNNPGQIVSGFNSADLNQNQREINHYAIVALQMSSGDRLDYQIAPFTRYSETKFSPDPVGDLIFNRFADRSQLSSWSSGIQSDASYKLSDDHTLRFGAFFSVERTIAQLTSDVFSTGSPCAPMGDLCRISDPTGKTGYLYGLYLQDEWAISDTVTLNFGGRFDIVNAFTNENQVSPRINLVWKPDADTTIHAGYARDFTPPPQELAPSQSIDKFNGTTKQPELQGPYGAVKAEREHYFDIGALRTVIPGLDLGLDAYYKIKRNLLDEGQFGESLIESPFNYRFGRAYGVEATASYHNGPLSLYTNVAYGQEKAKDIVSSQFFFGRDELDYIRNHAIYTDHDQPWTISGGGSFAFTDPIGQLRTSFDLIFGSGLRRSPGDAIEPNGEKLPSYTQVNIGLAQDIETNGVFAGTTARFDIVNLFDESYEIRDGTGVGVGAPQFGPRRAFYAGISKSF